MGMVVCSRTVVVCTVVDVDVEVEDEVVVTSFVPRPRRSMAQPLKSEDTMARSRMAEHRRAKTTL